jgi:inositol 2-dehydrogenase
MSKTINVGILGLGRMGSQYARYFQSRIPGARLYAVTDIRPDVTRTVAKETGAVRAFSSYEEMLADKAVDAVVIMTPTRHHEADVTAAAKAGKAIFCEKPLTLDVAEGERMETAVRDTGVFFQLGFMRRFDKAYAAAMRQIEDGTIGRPVVFKSTSRDQFPPSVDYLRPSNSGGLFIDMGIHDFDLARWFMGEVKCVYSAGSAVAYPEIGVVGDVDNALATLQYQNGCIGVVSLSRSGIYGYAIDTEIVGTKGTLRIGYDRETAILIMKEKVISYDTVPGFYERFEQAYITQLQNFVDNLIHGRPAPITCRDGISAQKIAIAATKSLHSQHVELV